VQATTRPSDRVGCRGPHHRRAGWHDRRRRHRAGSRDRHRHPHRADWRDPHRHRRHRAGWRDHHHRHRAGSRDHHRHRADWRDRHHRHRAGWHDLRLRHHHLAGWRADHRRQRSHRISRGSAWRSSRSSRRQPTSDHLRPSWDRISCPSGLLSSRRPRRGSKDLRRATEGHPPQASARCYLRGVTPLSPFDLMTHETRHRYITTGKTAPASSRGSRAGGGGWRRLVEMRGLEPLTPAMRTRCSSS
jgi:hypothetical protein